MLQKYIIICLHETHNHLSHASEELMQGKNHKKLGSKKKTTTTLLLKNKMNLLTKMWNISTSKRDGVSSILKFGRRTTK